MRFLRACVAMVAMIAAGLGAFSVASPAFAADPYQIGVYYYPGWSPEIKGPRTPDTWNDIRRFPNREPELGWYHDGKKETLDKQLDWMASHGIDFTVFDWYWKDGKPKKETSVRAYLASEGRKKVRYALMWANHWPDRTVDDWDALSDFWISNHLKNPEYVKVDGKPVLIIFSPEVLAEQSKSMGMPVAEMLDRARAKARKAGLPGIYFVLCVPAMDHWVKGFAPKGGFDAITAYNYHFGVAGDPAHRTRPSESFDELDKGYQMQWKWILANSKLPYFIPMTSGWDREPWSETRSRNKHDDSMSTPPEFEDHLRAGRAMMDAEPVKTKRIGIMCCWNEYGEGSYIEPTKRDGMKYLERVRKVFGGDK